jgi:lipid II:glycine glycyltransferase (peptidoglycan interpeptide bridge formation enzyme)
VNPFCEYGFPLIAAGVETASVLATIRETAGNRRTLLLKESDWTRTMGYNEHGFGGVETGRVRRLPLSDSFGELAEHVFDRKLRQNVNKARESGVQIRNVEDVDAFYDLYLAAMRRRGSPQFPRRFFEGLTEEFGEQCSVLLAESEGTPIAGLLALDYGGRRHLLLNGSDHDYWDLRPNDLLYWHSIQQACERGYDLVDFGRSEAGSGVARFKERFGGHTSRLTTLARPPHRAGAGDVSGYRQLEPIARRLSPVLTHPAVGPRLKEWIHE